VRALGLDRSSDGFEFNVDAMVLAVTLGTAVLAALISGLPPVIALLRDDLTRAVHEAGRQSACGARTHALRGTLVVVQIGMSVALLVGAGLLTKSFYRLQGEGPGFNAASVWTGALNLPPGPYATRESWTGFQRQALEELRALPGVAEAGFTSVLPFRGNNEQGNIAIDGFVADEGAPPPHTQHRSINEDFFSSLGMTVTAGRNFNATETERVAIIDANLEAKFWPNGGALGQRLRHVADPDGTWYTIVGVVSAVKQASLAETSLKETVYWHYAQRPRAAGVFTLRTMIPPAQLTLAATAAIAAIDPELALHDVQPMDLRVLESLGPQRTPMVLSLVFAAVAFTLAVIGIYGVLTWAVTQRIGEIGVRMALGARANDIVRMVLTQGVRLIAVGIAAGLAGALALGRVLASQMQYIDALDPAVLATALVGLGAAALIASWLPARRASRIDPMRALREE
jgi:predicted permease